MPIKFSDISTQSRRNLIKRILKQAPDDGLSITEIHEIYSKEHGHDSSRKTIERDIEFLSKDNGVYVVDENAATKLYAIAPDYAEELEITITEEHLQILNLSLGLLGKLGPKALTRIVADTENALVETLPKELKKDFENFKSLQTIQASLAGKAILEESQDLTNVLLALRKGRMIEGEYFSKHRGMIEKRKLGPIFIELFGGSPYLLAEDPEDKETPIKRFKLSRLKKTEILKEKYTPPERHECEPYFNSFAGVGGASTEEVDIKVWGTTKLADYFSEIELHPSQKLTPLEDGRFLLEFKMPLAYHFIRCLAGFGGEITYMEPTELKYKVRAIWKKGAEACGMIVGWPERKNQD